MAIRMELARILIRELNDYQVIELREVLSEGEAPKQIVPANAEEAEGLTNGQDGFVGRSFPIVIGLPEAQAIERRLAGVPVKRPQTHDLLANVITALGGVLESVTINDLSDHTFFARLNVMREDGERVEIDSRPSDAIALGIAGNVPIFVEEHVLESVVEDQA
ncbi:MAG: bifunctional nuclease family protein [Phycisphaeraceae bacterium]|nr:bifunctional nuclease family protein [Phycisphaeraceae bacterium]